MARGALRAGSLGLGASTKRWLVSTLRLAIVFGSIATALAVGSVVYRRVVRIAG